MSDVWKFHIKRKNIIKIHNSENGIVNGSL